MPPEYCPHCGAEVPPNAKACPGCGSDEQTGWSDRAHTDRLGIPDEEFDYDEFVKEEFGKDRDTPVHRRKLDWLWQTIGVGLLVSPLVLWWLASNAAWFADSYRAFVQFLQKLF
jgi:hypothetical protein